MLSKRQTKFFLIAISLASIILFIFSNLISDELALLPMILVVAASFPWSLIFAIVGEVIFVDIFGYDVFAFESSGLHEFFTVYLALYINIFIFIKLFVKDN